MKAGVQYGPDGNGHAPSATSDILADVFPGDSVMAGIMRAHDWAATPLGPPEAWPEGLKVPLRMMLTSRFEMWLGWGEDLAFFYNDAYIPTLGKKHPAALGTPMSVVWKEVFADVEDRIVSVMRDGVATWDKALLLLLERSGYPEETYHTFSYSPLRGDAGEVGGLMCVVTEETERVISERRLETLRTLATALLGVRTRGDVAAAAESALATNTRDFPFSLVRLFDAEETGDPLEQIAWPFDRLPADGSPLHLDLAGLGQAFPSGPWPTPPRDALILPIPRAGEAAPAGALVLGLNPLRHREAEVEGFAKLIAGQIAGAISAVETHLSEAAEVERLRQLFEQSPSFMAVLRGPEHRFELVNPGYLQLVGNRELQGKTIREALPEVVNQGFVDLLDGVYVTGQPYRGRSVQVTLQRGRDDPEDLFLDFVYQPIRSAEGAITGVFVEGIDVTASHHAAQALADLNATLEQQVQARTGELMAAEEKLRQSQKMEAVGQLTGGIAHDFNNLLAGVTGSLELIEKRIGQGRLEAVPRYIDAAQGAARRATALTQRLLAFSRRSTLAPRAVDLDRLIGGMEELVRRTVGGALEIEVQSAGSLWLTLVDPNQLENALLNLCINARDAMPDGGRLTISTSNETLGAAKANELQLPAGEYVRLSVTDTGTGMPAEVVDRIFDPFFTTKPLGLGTGLGLSMVYGFVRQSGGQVRVDSAPGRGTTMHLYLPRHRGVAVEEFTPASPKAPEVPGGGERVLVIDDEAAVRMLMTEVLEEAGYVVLSAANGAAGLKMLDSDARIDMLVTDVGLPGGLNGRQVADAARARRPGLKVLFVTGYAETAVIGHGDLDPGMQVITKPFAMAALSARVREMLEP